MKEPDQSGWSEGERAAYAEAERLIEEARANRAEELHFFESNLRALPPGLGELSDLKELQVFRSSVSDLSPLAGLSGLQNLDISGTQVSDLSPLAGLSGLQGLDFRGTQVSDLSPLAGLSGLQRLYAGRTQVSDLSPLVGLSNLQSLNFNETQVSDLLPLAGLSGLQSLDVSKTRVSDLSPLSDMGGLQWLKIDQTQVFNLAPLRSILSSLTESSRRDNGLVFWGTPVTEDPKLAEIAELSPYARMLELQKYLFPEDVSKPPQPAPSTSAPPFLKAPLSPIAFDLQPKEGGGFWLQGEPSRASDGRTSPNPRRLQARLEQAQARCETLIVAGRELNAGPTFAHSLGLYRDQVARRPDKVVPNILEDQLKLALWAVSRNDHPDMAGLRRNLEDFRDSAHRELMEEHFPSMDEQEAAAEASAVPPDAPVLSEARALSRALEEGAEEGVSPENVARYAEGALEVLEISDPASVEGSRSRKRVIFSLAGLAAAILKAGGVRDLKDAAAIASDLKNLGALEPIMRKALEFWQAVKGYFGF